MAEEQKELALSFSEGLALRLENISDGLPKDFNKVRFVQNALALVNDTPGLAKYGKEQLYAGLIKCAVLGLDAFNKECYLIPYGDKLQFQIDYKGAKKLAKRYSIRPIHDIYAEIVRDGDDFKKEVIENETKITFKPIPFNDGEIVGAFAVCMYEDGGCVCDTMSKKELENTRRHSKASNSMAWKDFTSEMYKKTVLHRLCKHIELDFENPAQRNYFTEDVAIDTTKSTSKASLNDVLQQEDVYVESVQLEKDV